MLLNQFHQFCYFSDFTSLAKYWAPTEYQSIMMSSNGNIFCVTGPFVQGIHWSQVNSSHKGQWCGALMFSSICGWIHSWVNNRDAGNLRRHGAHYDVTVMFHIWQALLPINCGNTCQIWSHSKNLTDIFFFLQDQNFLNGKVTEQKF